MGCVCGTVGMACAEARVGGVGKTAMAGPVGWLLLWQRPELQTGTLCSFWPLFLGCSSVTDAQRMLAAKEQLLSKWRSEAHAVSAGRRGWGLWFGGWV